MYERQELIKDLHLPEVATVVGCGGTGFWTAAFLAMSGVENLILIDPDVVDASNLNRLPLGRGSVGIRKIEALEHFIYSQLDRRPRIERHLMKIQSEEDCQLLRGTVFCCTDNLKSQQLVLAYCRKNTLPYQRIGYDGTVLNVSRSFPMTFKEDVPDGYDVTPSWVAPAALAASAGVASQLYKDIVIMDDISLLTTTGLSVFPEGLVEKVKEEQKEEIENNFYDHFPEHGFCPDCDHDGYGYCGDCNRGDCEGCDYYSPESVEEERAEACQTTIDCILKYITDGTVKEPSDDTSVSRAFTQLLEEIDELKERSGEDG